jgi:hypothetical protein
VASEETEEKYFSDDAKQSMLEMARRPVAVLTIAQAHGVPQETLRRRVEEEDEFGLAFQKARATLQANLVGSVMDRGDNDWRMHAHLLERLFPSGYAKERPNTIKIESATFDWNQLGRIDSKDLPKREVKEIPAESVEVNDPSD